MTTTAEHRAIIERIEQVRKSLDLNKSRFSADIGMKPQTYNNFIGAQGSKPNVELIRGVINVHGVSPEWLLFGTGPMWSTGCEPARLPAHLPPDSLARLAALEADMDVVKRAFGRAFIESQRSDTGAQVAHSRAVAVA